MGTPFQLSRRRLLGSALASAMLGTAAPQVKGKAPALRLIGEATLAHRLSFKGTNVGGLSGLDYAPTTDLWFALSDDRSVHAPARLYTLALHITPRQLAPPQLLDVITLRQDDGSPFPARRLGGDVPDPEALRLRPGTGTLLWTSEGDRRLGLAPTLREMDSTGRHLRHFDAVRPIHSPSEHNAGPRDNLALEGLALTPDGRHCWLAMEAALIQDGPVPTVDAPGGPCRFSRIDLASGQADMQRAYVPDAIPGKPLIPGTFADNGVSEVLMIDVHRMLVLERAYMAGVGNSIRLYQVDTREGSDTLALHTLAPGQYQPLPKRLVANFADLGLSRLDNTEGMAWGPTLPDGKRTIVFVSDDNFNPAQVTQFVACAFTDLTA